MPERISNEEAKSYLDAKKAAELAKRLNVEHGKDLLHLTPEEEEELENIQAIQDTREQFSPKFPGNDKETIH